MYINTRLTVPSANVLPKIVYSNDTKQLFLLHIPIPAIPFKKIFSEFYFRKLSLGFWSPRNPNDRCVVLGVEAEVG